MIGSTRVSNDESVNYGYGKFMTTEKTDTVILCPPQNRVKENNIYDSNIYLLINQAK